MNETEIHHCTPACEDTHRPHLLHMTDGRWHDDCQYCLRRREKGRTGLESNPSGWFQEES
jgi:hypothetical protein